MSWGKLCLKSTKLISIMAVIMLKVNPFNSVELSLKFGFRTNDNLFTSLSLPSRVVR